MVSRGSTVRYAAPRPEIRVRVRSDHRPATVPALIVLGLLALFSLASAVLMGAALYRATAPATPLEAAYAPAGTHPIDIREVSPWVVKATVSTEDETFFQHRGISLQGLFRAAVSNLVTGGLGQGPGGSSITQQLVKNVLVPPEKRLERSLSRKVQEAFYAIGLERQYTKDEILGWYLGVIYYGNGAYGIEAASQTYFDKHASDLTLAEATYLAGIPQWPARYDPFTAPQDVKQRQAEVLQLMAEHGIITMHEAQSALDQDLRLVAAQ